MAQRNGGRERLLMYGETSTPVYKRIMKPEDGMRPQLINLYSCNTVLIEDVTLLNSPFWVIHPLFAKASSYVAYTYSTVVPTETAATRNPAKRTDRELYLRYGRRLHSHQIRP